MHRVRCPISPLVAVLRDLYGKHVFPAKLSPTATQSEVDVRTCLHTHADEVAHLVRFLE